MNVEKRIEKLEKNLELLSDTVREQNRVLELQTTTIDTIFKQLGIVDKNQSGGMNII